MWLVNKLLTKAMLVNGSVIDTGLVSNGYHVVSVSKNK
jgi:hypothetical protein